MAQSFTPDGKWTKDELIRWFECGGSGRTRQPGSSDVGGNMTSDQMDEAALFVATVLEDDLDRGVSEENAWRSAYTWLRVPLDAKDRLSRQVWYHLNKRNFLGVMSRVQALFD